MTSLTEGLYHVAQIIGDNVVLTSEQEGEEVSGRDVLELAVPRSPHLDQETVVALYKALKEGRKVQGSLNDITLTLGTLGNLQHLEGTRSLMGGPALASQWRKKSKETKSKILS